ncbi:MAG: hypothetical protein DMF94_34735 [Acidobacteria bacterium]|nr:MAG: hypothetical protein DMF94_34735 [Acidobacteriota bacterium]
MTAAALAYLVAGFSVVAHDAPIPVIPMPIFLITRATLTVPRRKDPIPGLGVIPCVTVQSSECISSERGLIRAPATRVP